MHNKPERPPARNEIPQAGPLELLRALHQQSLPARTGKGFDMDTGPSSVFAKILEAATKRTD